MSDWERGERGFEYPEAGPDPEEPRRRAEKALDEQRRVARKRGSLVNDADQRLADYLASRSSDAEFELKASMADRYASVDWASLEGQVIRWHKLFTAGADRAYTYAALILDGRAWLTGTRTAPLSIDRLVVLLLSGADPVPVESVEILGLVASLATKAAIEVKPHQRVLSGEDDQPMEPDLVMRRAYSWHRDRCTDGGEWSECTSTACRKFTQQARAEFVDAWFPRREGE